MQQGSSSPLGTLVQRRWKSGPVTRLLPAPLPALLPGLAFLILLASAWSLLACRPEAVPERGLALRDTNILLVVVDTLGASYVGALARQTAMGDPAAATTSPTPNLDRLARQGVLFRRAYSTAPWTQPSLASLLTGKMPSSHGLTRLFDVLKGEELSLPERLQAEGYDTAAVVGHDLLGAPYGFDQGFNEFDETSARGHRGTNSQRITDLSLNWLKNRSPRKPFFLMAHYFDPHFVYQHHPEHDRTSGYRGHLTPGMNIWDLRNQRQNLEKADLDYLRGLYQEEIAHTDLHIGRLLEGLDEADSKRPTLVIVTADHGEEFMEHGWIGHTRSLYDELLHVPLIFHLPSVLAPAEVGVPVSLVDIFPTVSAGLRPKEPGQASVEELDGQSLWPLLSMGVSAGPRVSAGAVSSRLGENSAAESALEKERLEQRQIIAEVSFEVGRDKLDRHGEKVVFGTALFAGELKMIHDLIAETWQLFDRSLDPGELTPLSASHSQFRDLQSDLLRWERGRSKASSSERRTPSTEELERLRSLGYLR